MNKKSRRPNRIRFALCIESGEYPASLQRRKVYEVEPDPDAEKQGQLRVIDDSGEDYLYPREYFQLLELTPFLRRLLRPPAGGQGEPVRSIRSPAKIRAAR
jgi:hypothetical protein